MASWTLPTATPSASALNQLSPHEYKRLRREMAQLLAAEVPRFAYPMTRAGLVVTRYGKRLLAWDNAVAGLKPLLDCLVAQDAQHPDGLGYLADDMPDSGLPHAPWVVQGPAVRAGESERTEVQLYRLR